MYQVKQIIVAIGKDALPETLVKELNRTWETLRRGTSPCASGVGPFSFTSSFKIYIKSILGVSAIGHMSFR